MSIANRPSKHVHKLVYETALALGHELYDHVMQNDAWYAEWVKQNPGLNAKQREEKYVKKYLALLVPKARATLAGMLAQPIAEVLKEQILEALTLDASLMRGRARPQQPPLLH